MNLTQFRRSQVLSAILIGGGVVASCFVACQKNTSTPQPNPAIASGATPVAKLPPIPDGDIAQAIRKYMQENAALRSEHVQVTVTQGIASLLGLGR